MTGQRGGEDGSHSGMPRAQITTFSRCSDMHMHVNARLSSSNLSIVGGSRCHCHIHKRCRRSSLECTFASQLLSEQPRDSTKRRCVLWNTTLGPPPATRGWPPCLPRGMSLKRRTRPRLERICLRAISTMRDCGSLARVANTFVIVCLEAARRLVSLRSRTPTLCGHGPHYAMHG